MQFGFPVTKYTANGGKQKETRKNELDHLRYQENLGDSSIQKNQ